jgi:hypothetical protein
VTKEEFGQLVRRAQAGDPVAKRELRAYGDNPRRRREAAERAYHENPQAVARKRAERPHRSTDSQLRINRAVLWDVRELLGITKAVTVRLVAADEIPGLNGSHEFTPEGEHLIRLRTGRSAEDTNRTALHELAHAASADSYRNRWQWARVRDIDPQRYEDEANEVARLLSHMKVVA